VGSLTLPHNNVVKSTEDLMKVSGHINIVLNKKLLKKFKKISYDSQQQFKVFDGLAYKHVHLEVIMNLRLLIIEEFYGDDKTY